MADAKSDNPREAHALALATEAITSGTEDRLADALRAWRTASDYADRHLAGRGIDRWIKAGLGSALHDVGQHASAITEPRSALAWCIEHRAVLPSLTIVKSLSELGDQRGAAEHVRQARLLRGDRVIDALDPEGRDEMRTQSEP